MTIRDSGFVPAIVDEAAKQTVSEGRSAQVEPETWLCVTAGDGRPPPQTAEHCLETGV